MMAFRDLASVALGAASIGASVATSSTGLFAVGATATALSQWSALKQAVIADE